MRTGWSSLKIIFTHYRVDINYTPETGEPFCDQKDSQLLSPLAGKQEKLTIDENKEKPAKLLNFTVTYGLAGLLPDENANGPKSGSVDTYPNSPHGPSPTAQVPKRDAEQLGKTQSTTRALQRPSEGSG